MIAICVKILVRKKMIFVCSEYFVHGIEGLKLVVFLLSVICCVEQSWL
jgi:hypothetical protein